MSMAQAGVVAPWRAAYAPGDWYVIAGPTSLVVLQPGPGRADMLGDLWADVVASSSISDLVDRLAGYGITELPDLAVIFWSATGMRTLVRGGVWLDDPQTGDRVAAGEGVVTWNEVGLEHLESVRVRMREQSADGEALPLAVGVVRSGGISLSADEDAVVRSPQPLLGSAGAAGSPGRLPDTDGAASIAPAGVGLDNESALGQSVEDVGDQQVGGDAPAAVDDSGPDFPPIEADDGEPSQTGGSEACGMDGPWGPQPSTSASTGLDGGLSAAAAAGSPAAAGSVSGAPSSTSPSGSADSPAVLPGPGAGSGESSSSRSVGSAQSTTEFSFDQFEMENDDTQLMANPVIVGADDAPVDPTAVATTEALIEAVRCPDGHANAPGSQICRVCRTSIADTRIELIAEPVLARLRAADGTVVDLDRAVLMGRAPSEQRSTVPLPRLVALASPAQDISRTHLQLVPENWQVMVTDLNSTNGTFVTDSGPGGHRGLLPPGQATPVPIGAVLELGEGVTVTIEPAE